MRQVTSLFVFGALMAATAASAHSSAPSAGLPRRSAFTTSTPCRSAARARRSRSARTSPLTIPGPRVLLKNFTAAINYDSNSMRLEQVRDLSVPQPRGGGASFSGAEQRRDRRRQRRLLVERASRPTGARRRRSRSRRAGGRARAGQSAGSHPDALGDAAGLREGGARQQRHHPLRPRRHRGLLHARRQVPHDRRHQRDGPGRAREDVGSIIR